MFVDGLNEKPLKSLPAKPLSWSIPLLGQPLEMHYLDTLTSMASEMTSHQCRLLSICGQILFLSVARWTEFVKDRHLGGGVGIREEREVTYDHRENPSFSPSLPSPSMTAHCSNPELGDSGTQRMCPGPWMSSQGKENLREGAAELGVTGPYTSLLGGPAYCPWDPSSAHWHGTRSPSPSLARPAAMVTSSSLGLGKKDGLIGLEAK